MTRLAIADPPYLGRAQRWYGTEGRGSGGGQHRADEHPNARDWDNPDTHRALVRQLDDNFAGWAIAATPASLPIYLSAAPTARVMVWNVTNSPPSGWRVQQSWEAVILRIPPGRTAQGTGYTVRDVLACGSPRRGFTGSKPAAWTRWVLTALGYDSTTDTVTDLFPGSLAVTLEAEQIL